jgi:hypothetical protein
MSEQRMVWVVTRWEWGGGVWDDHTEVVAVCTNETRANQIAKWENGDVERFSLDETER